MGGKGSKNKGDKGKNVQVVSSNSTSGGEKATAPVKEFDHLYKILIIGDAGVGKSSLLLRFCDGTFPDKFITSIGSEYKDKVISTNGHKYKLQLWDTAGQERFRTITSSFYRGAHGVALCYDVASKESFGNISNWIKQLDEYAKKQLPKVLCALKTDIGGREVTDADGKDLADQFGMELVECSAKDGKNVDLVFETLVKVISAEGASDADDD